jgi:hypothetical protein
MAAAFDRDDRGDRVGMHPRAARGIDVGKRHQNVSSG